MMSSKSDVLVYSPFRASAIPLTVIEPYSAFGRFRSRRSLCYCPFSCSQFCSLVLIPLVASIVAVAYFQFFRSSPTFTEAVFHGDLETVKRYIRLNNNYAIAAIPNDTDHRTALHLAAYGNRSDIVRYLILYHSAPLSAVDDNRWTPLHYAALEGSAAMIHFMIRHGAVVNARDRFNRTPLHVAVIRGNHDCTRALLESRQAHIDAVDADGYLPIEYGLVMARPQLVRLLEASGAKRSARIPLLQNKAAAAAATT